MSDTEKEESGRGYSALFVAAPGKPIALHQITETSSPPEMSPLVRQVAATMKAYRRAAEKLMRDKYAASADIVPPHLRQVADIWVIACSDGILIRYDPQGTAEPKVRFTELANTLCEIVPGLTEQVIHIADDPTNYTPQQQGPGIIFSVTDPAGVSKEFTRLHPIIIVPASAIVQSAPADEATRRPRPLASLHRELKLDIHGMLGSTASPLGGQPATEEHFIAHGPAPLNVGWLAVEVYPRLVLDAWNPDLAPYWAEADILAAIASANAEQNALNALDGRRAARKHYRKLLNNFANLLDGPEEPAHQFLKAHPDLICPARQAYWSKHPFGPHRSDFIFREHATEYLLVEIEAPTQRLFRKDGHPRAGLTHAIGQVQDWQSYIQRNMSEVVSSGLAGIASNPRCLVVIGRSSGLTTRDRIKLQQMQMQSPSLTILTYDDLVARFQATIENLYGPLSMEIDGGAGIYFFSPAD